MVIEFSEIFFWFSVWGNPWKECDWRPFLIFPHVFHFLGVKNRKKKKCARASVDRWRGPSKWGKTSPKGHLDRGTGTRRLNLLMLYTTIEKVGPKPPWFHQITIYGELHWARRVASELMNCLHDHPHPSSIFPFFLIYRNLKLLTYVKSLNYHGARASIR